MDTLVGIVDFVIGLLVIIAVSQLFPIKRYLHDIRESLIDQHALQMQNAGLNSRNVCGSCHDVFFEDRRHPLTECPHCGIDVKNHPVPTSYAEWKAMQR